MYIVFFLSENRCADAPGLESAMLNRQLVIGSMLHYEADL